MENLCVSDHTAGKPQPRHKHKQLGYKSLLSFTQLYIKGKIATLLKKDFNCDDLQCQFFGRKVPEYTHILLIKI